MIEVVGIIVGIFALLVMICIAVESAFELNPVYTLVKVWNNLREKLNLAGCIICIIPVGIISLPGMIVSSVLIGIFYGVDWFWKGFTHVFRKRK